VSPHKKPSTVETLGKITDDGERKEEKGCKEISIFRLAK
jgi:hypothetical protein